ncbi:MAG: prepilin peptidase [Lachnospiraceae bacterium]|nr:prepilin peptidase [Lachnospiraceae bacterium]
MTAAFNCIRYGMVLAFGVVVGSFLNVCIYRIPRKETVVTTPSHCMSCGYRLRWYDLIPVASWLALRGRCRKCGEKLSVQYPLVEGGNGLLWILTFAVCGWSVRTALSCLVLSALLVISVIDWRTYEIPPAVNFFIGAVGVIRLLLEPDSWPQALAGFAAVSGFLLIVYAVTKGRGIGGGDIKLMAAAGLYLGLANCIAAFMFGCLYACIVHPVRMKRKKAGSMLALGPYLAAGILTAIWFGDRLVGWYLSLFTGM